MRTNSLHYESMIYAIALAVAFLVGCDKDINEDSVKQAYSIKFSDVVPYDSTRYLASDSLMQFIIDNMAIEEPDTMYNTWIVKGKSIEDCDSIVKKSFENACSLVDPDEYGGLYSIYVYRKTSSGNTVLIANDEFVAATGNNVIDLHELLESLRKAIINSQRYLYDLALGSGNRWQDAGNALSNNGYSVINCDLNKNAGGKWVFIGYKAAAADFVTNITGEVPNEFTGETEFRQLTAKELAITKIICLQTGDDWHHPNKFSGEYGTALQTYQFEGFKTFGDSNGDTNQGAGGVYSWLYFSRSNNQNQYISNLYVNTEPCNFPWDELSTDGRYVQLGTYNSNTGRVSPKAEVADLNRGTWDDYVYLGADLSITGE